MKNLSLVGLALIVAGALAREHVIFANKTEPLVNSRHFQQRNLRQPNFSLATFTVNSVAPLSGNVATSVPAGTISHPPSFAIPAIGDTSVLANFFIPSAASASNCQVILSLDPAAGIVAPPGAQFEVYKLNSYPVGPGPWSAATSRIGASLGPWPLTANPFPGGIPPGDSSGPALTFPCSTYAGGNLYLEFAPYNGGGLAGETISWNDALGGPIIYIVP